MRKILLVITFLSFWLTSFSQCTVQLPANQTVCINDSFTITTILGTGMNPTGYEWFLNGSTTPIAGETNSTLVIPSDVVSTDTYRVEVSDPLCGATPATDVITVNIIDVIATQPMEFNVCDDDTDGFATFNLATLNSEVLDTLNPAFYTVTYHILPAEADTNTNAITPLLFPNTVAFNQEIFIRVENNNNTSCFDTTSVQLFVRPLPIINTPINYFQCDNDTDGIVNINLFEINNQITTEANITFSYFTSMANAVANNAIGNPENYNVNSSIQLFSRATTIYGCFKIAEVNITISTSQIPLTFFMPNPDPLLANPLIVEEFVQCDNLEDDNDDYNGINTFNIGAAIPFIRDLFPSQQNLVVTFFESEIDAILENNVIADPFQYRNLVPTGQDLTMPVEQDIWVRVDNHLDDTCVGLGQHIKIIVNPLPKYNVLYENQICLGETNTISTDFDNSSDNFSFNWTKDDIITGSQFLSTDEFIDITSAGTYTVTITNNITLCSKTQSVEITESEKPNLEDIEILTFNKPNNKVVIEVIGIGNYEFALENTMFYPDYGRDDRDFQDSKIFKELNPGEYEVTIRDKNLCGELKTKFIILDYKPFFTPNGDAKNETWIINGMELYPLSILTIFDKYGKVLAQLDQSSIGWNGVYKGEIMNDSDYWFRLEYINNQGVRNSQNGHFSLITGR